MQQMQNNIEISKSGMNLNATQEKEMKSRL